MRTVGLIMECNPFHKGHQHILTCARELADGGPLIVILSGDFTQRGIPAICSKEERTKEILLAGADLILELPVVYATASAETFANGAIGLLSSCGIVTDLVFGSESGDLHDLLHGAYFLAHEPDDFRLLLKQYLSSGENFPTARAKAAKNCSQHVDLPRFSNDLLGEEYLKALIRNQLLGSTKEEGKIVPHAVPRMQTDSASYLRSARKENDDGIFEDDFSPLLLEALLMISRNKTGTSFSDYMDISSDLAQRMETKLPQFVSWTQFCHLLKTKNLTYTAVSRALSHILLDIRKNDRMSFPVTYSRVLGIRRSHLFLLRQLKEQGFHPIICKEDADNLLSQNEPEYLLLSHDLEASQLYDLVSRMKQSHSSKQNKEETENGSAPLHEFRKKLFVLD